MTQEIFNLKKNRYSISDWIGLKNAAKKAGATHITTGKSKFMFYAKITAPQSVWKQILKSNEHQFEYVPGGASVNWNKIKVKL